MGCRPSKQATSKVRAIEHKEDPRCLCSPRKVRKNHKCSDGSSTSSKRVSGGIKSGSKKHSFSSGHKPRAAKSADMDFPAFSTTTAVYRKSASKTSKITLRLSCDGSTLEIEQCDYDLERAYGETAPKPRPWSSAPNLSRLRDGKARLFRDSYLPMKHSKSAWSPSVTSTASGSRDCKVRVPVFINTTEERMSSRSLANTGSHRSSNASQTGSCSSRQRGSTGTTALPRTCSRKDGPGVAYMGLTDANRSLTFHEGQCSPGNKATGGSSASFKECGGGISKMRAYGNSTEARSGAMHMTASCTLENMMNDLECSLKMSHHPAYSSCWKEGNQPNLPCSLVPNQPNFSVDEITARELNAASSARYVIETSSDDSFHSENSSEFEQIPVNVISSFIAPASGNTACCETDSNDNPIGVSSDIHHLSDSHEARWSREGDARECLISAHQTNPNHVSCLKNGLRDLQFEKLRCANAKSTKLFKNSIEANPYSRSEEPVSYDPSQLWAKARRMEGADPYPNQNSPYLASPIDTNSILTFVTLGCPVSNEMPSFLCSPEDEATPSLFTPQHNMIYPYDGVCNPYDGVCNPYGGVCIHDDRILNNCVGDRPTHPSPRNTPVDTDYDLRSVQGHVCRNHRAADDEAPIDNLGHFLIGGSQASVVNHGRVPVSSLGHGKDATSSRTIDLGPVVEAPCTELPRNGSSHVSSVSCVEHETGSQFNCPGLNVFVSTEETPCLQNIFTSETTQGGNFTSTPESSNSNETSESSNSESSNSDETLLTIERRSGESPRRSEYLSSQHCSMFSHAPGSDSSFSADYVYCNSHVNVENGNTNDRRLTNAECLIVGARWGSAGQITCSTTSEDSDHRCAVGEIKEADTPDRFDANGHPWADGYGGRYDDKQSNSNHSSSSAETIQIIHCESITPHDGYRRDADRDGSNEKADYLVELLKDDPSQKLATRHVETRFSYDFDYNRERETDTISVSDASDCEISPLVYKYLGGKESSSAVTRSVLRGVSDENDDASSALTSMQSVRLDILQGHLARLDPQIPSQRDLHEPHSIHRVTDDNYVPVACLSPVLEESFTEDEPSRGIKGIVLDNLLLPCTGLSNAIARDEITNRDYLVSLAPNELHWLFHGHEEEGDKRLRGTALQLRGDILAKNINELSSHLQAPPGNPPEGSRNLRMEIKKKRAEGAPHTPSTCCVSDTTLPPCVLTSSSASLTENPWGPPAPTLTAGREQLHLKESWRSIHELISGPGRPRRNPEHLQNRGVIDPRQETHLNRDNIPGAPVTPLRRLNGGEDMSGCACMSKCSSNNRAGTGRQEGCMRADEDTLPGDGTATARDQSSANGVFPCLIESAHTAPGTVRSEDILRGAFSCPNSGLAGDGLMRRDESDQPKITPDCPLLSARQRFFGKKCSDRCEIREPVYTTLMSQESIDSQLRASHTSQESVDALLRASHTSQESIDSQLRASHTSQESIDAQLRASHTSQESVDAQLSASHTSQESIDAQPCMSYRNTAAVSCLCPSDHTSAPVVEQPSNIDTIDQITVVTLDLYPGTSRDLKSRHECDFTQGAELETHNATTDERGTAPDPQDDPTSDITSHQSTPTGEIHRSKAADKDIRVNEPVAFKAQTSTHTSSDDTRQAFGQPSQCDVLKALEGISLAYRPNPNNNNNNGSTLTSSHLLSYSSQPSCTLALQHGIDPSSPGPPCCPVSAHSSGRPSKDPCPPLPSDSTTPSSSPAGSGSAGTSSLNNSRLFIDRAGVDGVNKPTAPNQESQQQNEETERVPRKNVLSLVRYFEKVPFAHRETK